MFQKSLTATAPNLFNNITCQLSGIKQKAFLNPTAWHNVFYHLITSKVDEEIFSVLFDEETGRPNAPIRVLVAMNILKEGHGWSDEQLFEQCRFNLLVMNALGLTNLDDDILVESTYYLFRKKLYEYQIKEGRNLIGECFQQLTKHHANIFGVNGKKLRMDSKLMGSNIATCSRLQLVISCLQVFYKSLSEEGKKRIPEEYQEFITSLMKRSSGQIVFKLDREEKSDYLKKLGELLMEVQQIYTEKDSSKYFLIPRIFEDQFSIEDQEVVVKKKEEISSQSIQSPHDPEATYRKKKDQKVQGYSINITETCNDVGLNLITDTKVEKSTIADSKFMQGAIEESENVVGKIKESYQDGAYHSQDNDKYGEENEKTFYFTGIQGKKGRFEFQRTDDQLLVTDTNTSSTYQADNYKEGKYRIKIEIGEGKTQCRYFTDQAIETFFKRKEIENLPIEIHTKRNNVEATVFQLCFLTRNNKTRYRGKFKTQLWATYRSTWINLRRMQIYLGGLCPDSPEMASYIQIYLQKLKNLLILLEKIYLRKLFRKYFSFYRVFQKYSIFSSC